MNYPPGKFFNPLEPTLEVDREIPLTMNHMEVFAMTAQTAEVMAEMGMIIQMPQGKEDLVFLRRHAPDTAYAAEPLIQKNSSAFPHIPPNIQQMIAQKGMEIITDIPYDEALNRLNSTIQEQAKSRGLTATPIKRIQTGVMVTVKPRPHWTLQPDAELMTDFPEKPSADELLDLYAVAKQRNSPTLMEFLRKLSAERK